MGCFFFFLALFFFAFTLVWPADEVLKEDSEEAGADRAWVLGPAAGTGTPADAVPA